ncbi:MAG: sporulation protein YqfD [Clostridia bacterium]|nr:sporulation protein YqfD [Clostridia bacterium]
MAFTNILAFFKGSVEIEAEGLFLERFLNICMRRGIFLSDVKRISDEKICARIGIGGFKEVRPIAKKTKTRVRIKAREGMPFLIHRYKKRRAVIVGVALFLGILWYLSSHIMGIDIVGNERIKTAEIESQLKNFGLYRGTLVSKIDRRLIQNKMMTTFDEIAWIGINIKGSRAYIEVRERLDTKQSFDEDVPCNIIADRDGVIKALEVRSGQTMVKINDMVEEGDLLVSGAMDSQVAGIRYAHSDGAVYAETIYKKVREYPLEFTEKVYTGQEKKRRSIEVFGQKINLYLKAGQPFEYFDQDNQKAEFCFGKPGGLSVGMTTDVYKEYIPEKRTRTVKQAVELGRQELSGEIAREVGDRAEILSKNVTYQETDKKKVEVTVEIVCREDIARQSAIDKTENID